MLTRDRFSGDLCGNKPPSRKRRIQRARCCGDFKKPDGRRSGWQGRAAGTFFRKK